MYYTYILEIEKYPGKYYRGHTSDLKKRLNDHNSGKCVSTRPLRPWKIKMYIAFESESLAIAFESYLKSGSGYAFAKKHFGL
jgi:predicted GIY-YIG superfamily endonuclease